MALMGASEKRAIATAVGDNTFSLLSIVYHSYAISLCVSLSFSGGFIVWGDVSNRS